MRLAPACSVEEEAPASSCTGVRNKWLRAAPRHGQFRVPEVPYIHADGLWQEAKEPQENLQAKCGHPAQKDPRSGIKLTTFLLQGDSLHHYRCVEASCFTGVCNLVLAFAL